MERFLAIERMVEADLACLADCWAAARRGGMGLPRLEDVLVQNLGNAAERMFVVERAGTRKFRFGIASDRIRLRIGFDVSGREIQDGPPWPARIIRLLERSARSEVSVKLVLAAETSHGEALRLAVDLLPIAGSEGACAGFVGFAHAYGRSSDTLEEFDVIKRTKVVAAVLARPESRGATAAALA